MGRRARKDLGGATVGRCSSWSGDDRGVSASFSLLRHCSHVRGCYVEACVSNILMKVASEDELIPAH